MSSITLNFTINIDATLLRTLLATARDIQLSQTIDPQQTDEAVPPPSPPADTVVEAPAPKEPAVLPEPAPVPLITHDRKPVQWHKKSITLVPEEQVALIINRIDMGELTSSTPTVNWFTKHHPNKWRAQRIVNILRNAPNRTLTFQNLHAQTGMPTTGNDALQSYLREMDKQGIITYTPRD